MKDKRFEVAINEIEKEKFLFTMTKEQIKDRITQNIKVKCVEENQSPVINNSGELEEMLEIQLKIDDWMNRCQRIELTLTHTGADEESDIYNIFASIHFEYDDLDLGKSNEIIRMSDAHTVSGRPEGVLDWLESQIKRMTSEEVNEYGVYFRYLFN